jgi:DNA-binding transcriptional regulator YiaG
MSGIELKCARIKARIPQYKLAAQLGITQTELSEYENERKLLLPEMAKQIKGVIENCIKNS